MVNNTRKDVRMFLKNKKILITGGTGSLAKHLIVHLYDKQGVRINDIVVLSRDEQKQHVMQQDWLFKQCKYIIHDIRDYDGLEQIVKGHDIVINCAAIKHVSKAQEYVMEAIKTNIIGTYNVITAVRNKAEHAVFVHIGTDKAVEPINYYGATKFLAEGIVKNFAKRLAYDTNLYFSVRYGNVVNSAGSVIPKFYALVRKSSPVYITHPKMTRFLMTFDDAVDVIMSACRAHPIVEDDGGVFVPLGLPSCYITDLVHIMIKQWDSKSEIIEGTVGSGEKIDEILLNQEENFISNMKVVGKTRSGYDIAYVQCCDQKRAHPNSPYCSNGPNLLTYMQLEQYLQENIKRYIDDSQNQ